MNFEIGNHNERLRRLLVGGLFLGVLMISGTNNLGTETDQKLKPITPDISSPEDFSKDITLSEGSIEAAVNSLPGTTILPSSSSTTTSTTTVDKPIVQESPSPESKLPQLSESSYGSPANFMLLATYYAQQTKLHGIMDWQHPGHSCNAFPEVEPSTVPDLTIANGWLEATNQLRVNLGVKPLELDERLNSSATNAAQQIVSTGEFKHLDQMVTTAPIVGQGWQALGENLGRLDNSLDFSAEALRTFLCFANSPTHLDTMTNPVFSKMGVSLHTPYTKTNYPELANQSLLTVHFMG